MVNIVKGFITAKPSLADCDVELIWAIWAWQLNTSKPAKNINGLNAKELVKLWKSGELSSPFNISRSRRKCQQHYPETRGKAYEKKKALQKRTKDDVKRETDLANRAIAKRNSDTGRQST